jgi:DNA-binding transcriptional LysR family regulator
MLARAGVAAPRMYGSASLAMIVRMTLDCIGVSVIAPVFLGKELARGELHLLDVEADALPELSFTASWVSGPESYAAKMIAQLAQGIAAQFNGGKPEHT